MKLPGNMSHSHLNWRNRETYLQKINIPSSRLASAEIIHRNKVRIVKDTDGGKIIKGTDGLITKSKNLYLSITSADCLPIFLFDPKKEIVGLIHAGWRSLARLESARQAKNILANAIEKIKKLGGAPESILAGIGPAICQKHYEVGLEVAEKFSGYPSAILEENNKISLDLKKIAELQLVESGVKKESIENSPECTFELPEKYFSARRDSPLTNCPVNNTSKFQEIDKFSGQQLVRGKPKEVEAMIAVIGMQK